MINLNKNTTINKIIAELETHLPYNQIVNNHEKEQITIDGIVPSIVIYPTNHSQIKLIFTIAKKNNLGIIPFGGQTKINLGNIPKKFDIALSTKNLNSIINHQQFDLTTTVEAGITLLKLQKFLAKFGQYLPINSPNPEKATIGGILSTYPLGLNTSNIGLPRDWLLGIKVALTSGEIIKGGGQVVKNVTGYDMPKLFSGALGTLGIILEATFKLTPIKTNPEYLLYSYDSIEKTLEIIEQFKNLDFAPDTVSVFNSCLLNSSTKNSSTQKSNYSIFCKIAGLKNTNKRKIEQLKNILNQHGNLINLENTELSFIEQNLINYTWNTKQELIILKINFPITNLKKLINYSLIFEKNNINNQMILDPLSGIMYLSLEFKQNKTNKNLLYQLLNEFRKGILNIGGFSVIQSCDIAIKRKFDVWERSQNNSFLMEAIKRKFDPNGILNKGRFIDKL